MVHNCRRNINGNRDMMVISEFALGYLTNLLYDSSKKIPEELSDTYSKIYDKAINELSNEYSLNKMQIDVFLHQEKVKLAIKDYLIKPDQSNCSAILINEFFQLFREEDFSREDAVLILSTFFGIIDDEIEKDPELRSYLQLYLVKKTYLAVQETHDVVQETNQGIHNLSQGFQEMSQRVMEIHERLVNDNKMDQTFGKELCADFQESIKKYICRIIDEDSEIGISEVYTELSAKEILPISLKFHDERSDRIRDYEVLELVKKEERLIISGESGAGKTTTLKWLNFIYATNYLEGKSENIPLYVELNSYTKGSFYDYVRIKSKGKGISKDILEMLLKGESIIFIDGFDLLSPTDGFFPYEEISNFVSEYSNCKFVISSRPSFFESIRSGFKISELEKLTDEKILTFINNYVPDEEIKGIIKGKVLNNEQLKSILTNPMLLYLMIKVAMEKKSNKKYLLPSNRSETYEAFISGLFAHYVKIKGKTLCANQVQIKNALTDLYFNLQCWNKVSCEYSTALDIIVKHVKDPRFKETTAQCILEDCFNLGFLVRKDPELEETKIEYGIHQSFQEYFTAIKLKELFENGFDISDAFSHPKWEEVVIFASEMLESVDEFIDSMLSKGEIFLASKCVNKASNETKERLCTLLADKIDSTYELEKRSSLECLKRIGTISNNLETDALRNGDMIWNVDFGFENVKTMLVTRKRLNLSKYPIRSGGFTIHYVDVRWEVVSALRKSKANGNVELLISLLKNRNEIMRWSAAYRLGEIKAKEAAKPLISLLIDKSEDESVRWSAAYALGEIKAEETVKPLISVLMNKDQDEDVRWNVAYALGEIKDKEAAKPLISILKNKSEDKDVRWSAAHALGVMKAKEASELLICILKDKSEDKDVRWSVAYELGEIKAEEAIEPLISMLTDNHLGFIAAHSLKKIYIVKCKEQLESFQKRLEDKLKSENKFLIDPVFELLIEIKKYIKSKTILFENAFQYRLKKADIHIKSNNKENIDPAVEGLKDAYIEVLVDELKFVKKPVTVVDYGCEEGKFFCALTTLSTKVIRNISYVGVDTSTRCRYISRLTAEKYGFNKKFKKEPEFLKPEVFSKEGITANYIVFMHLLHEVRLVYLVDQVHLFSYKVKNNGKIFILYQKQMIEEERSFALFDEEEDFELLFKDSGLKPYVKCFKFSTGKQLSLIEIEKVEKKYFTRKDAERNCLEVYKAKQAKLTEKRKQSGLTDKEYSEINIQLANIVEQIGEYERILNRK